MTGSGGRRADDSETPETVSSGRGHLDDKTVTAARPVEHLSEPEAPAHPKPGDIVGRYEIESVLGAGGGGVVYRARDPDLERVVAIKLIRPGSRRPRDSASDRLVREAQAIARLQHPNVVAVHDFGLWKDEVFIAMEYVPGQSMLDWLRDGDYGVDDVVRVFAQAARGLAAAHERGMIHRDFKPGNVMIDETGRVRVLDFGLARAVERAAQPAGDDNGFLSGVTGTGRLVGTPAYMSPEHHSGGTVDERSDQFALCATLYEAVCGQRAFAGDSVAEVTDNILAAAVRPMPEDVVAPRWLIELIERGLARSPNDRWPSMSAIAEELERDRTAHENRWRRRIAIGASLLGVAAVASVIAVVVTTRSVDQPDPCANAANRLDEVWNSRKRQQLVEAFTATRVPYNEAVSKTVARSIDEYTAAWSEMRVDACMANKVRGEQSDAVFDGRVACLNRRLADLQTHVSLLSDNPSVELVENAVLATASLPDLDHCADARAAAEQIVRPETDELRQAVAELNDEISELSILHVANLVTDIEPRLSDVLERARRLDWPHTLASALVVSGQIQSLLGDAEGAEASFVEALPLAAKSRDDYQLAHAQLMLMSLRVRDLDKRSVAAETLPQVDAAIARAGDPPRLRAMFEHSTGSLHDAGGDYDAALRHYERAHALSVEAFGRDHSLTTEVLNDVAVIHDIQGRREQALELYEEVLRVEESNHGPDHPRVAQTINNIAIVVVEDDPERALALYDRAVSIYRRAYGDRHFLVAITQLNRGVALQEQKLFSEAIEAYTEAAAIWKPMTGERVRYYATALSNLGDVAEAQGDCKAGLGHYRRAVEVLEDAGYAEHPDLAYPLLGVGSCEATLGRPNTGVAPLERALTLMRKNGLDPTEIASVQLALSRALWASGGDEKRARTLGFAARDARREAGDTSSDDYRDVVEWLASRGW